LSWARADRRIAASTTGVTAVTEGVRLSIRLLDMAAITHDAAAQAR
jgi:hypothetical protein